MSSAAAPRTPRSLQTRLLTTVLALWAAGRRRSGACPAGSGSCTRNSVPAPNWLRTLIWPPISWVSWREMVVPRPVPP